MGAIVAGLMLVPALAGPATAAADVTTAGGIKYVTKTVTTDPAQADTIVLVRCPGGTHVIGGGQTNDAGFGGIAVGATYPYDLGDADSKPDDAWRLIVNQEPPAHTLKVTAICANTEVSYASEPVGLSPDTQSFGNVFCPTGTHLYSPGASAGIGLNLNTLFPIDGTDADNVRDDGSGVYADNPNEFPIGATVYAVCGGHFPSYKKSVVQAPAQENTGVHVHCPEQTFVYGGGEENTGGFRQAGVSDLGPFGSPAPSHGWHPSVDNLSTDPFTLEAFAICGKAFA